MRDILSMNNAERCFFFLIFLVSFSLPTIVASHYRCCNCPTSSSTSKLSNQIHQNKAKSLVSILQDQISQKKNLKNYEVDLKASKFLYFDILIPLLLRLSVMI
ncbi:hypothetical protein ERO13_D12G056966v2 [Gossypium hirsutum]|nr:hypothetical protein ERO13_D12G056966v2 [Gossypium hirsutum]